MSQKKTKQARAKERETKVPQAKSRYRIVTFLLTASTLLGGLAALLTFLPRPTVSPPSTPFDIKNPFSVSFDISNSGYIPLEDCTALLGVGEIANGPDARLNPSFIPSFKSRFVMPSWKNHDLGEDERFTIVLTDLISKATAADIAIIVTYKPWFLPWKREKAFRFITQEQSNGQLYWRSWPMGEKIPPIK